VLVTVDGSAEARTAGLAGLQIAARFGSEVRALAVVDVRAVEGPAVETLAPLWGEVTGRPFQPEVLRMYRERAARTLTGLDRDARSAGVLTVTSMVDIGVAEEAILEHAAEADLVVAGRRGEHAGFGKQVVGATLWRVLHRSPCPVLVGADGSWTRDLDGGTGLAGVPANPLVAWDCSKGGRSALRLATAYASKVGSPLRIVHAGDEAEDDRLDEAHAALQAADVAWESVRLNLDPADAVAEAVRRWGADCLFMGAFGRGRLRDFLFGSRTLEILERFSGPVFVTP
jgi:nucleotide-binding universal stress UspA family protein